MNHLRSITRYIVGVRKRDSSHYDYLRITFDGGWTYNTFGLLENATVFKIKPTIDDLITSRYKGNTVLSDLKKFQYHFIDIIEIQEIMSVTDTVELTEEFNRVTEQIRIQNQINKLQEELQQWEREIK